LRKSLEKEPNGRTERQPRDYLMMTFLSLVLVVAVKTAPSEEDGLQSFGLDREIFPLPGLSKP